MKLIDNLFKRNDKIRNVEMDVREENVQKVLKESGDYMMHI
ncbi:MAG: hypothetical protein ACQEQG_10390 [Bacillota bacterium]